MILVYLIALIAGALWGVTESINKNITEKKYSAFSYFFIQTFFNLLLYLVPFILYGSFVKQPIAYLYVSIVIVLVFLSNLFMIKAYKTEDISNLNILSKSSIVITFLSGVFLLGEKTTFLNNLGIVIIVLGILVIFYEGKKITLSSGFILALTSGIIAGVNSYFRKLALFYFNPISYVFLVHLFLTIFLLFLPKTYRDLKPIITKYKKKILLSRLTAVVGFYLISWAFVKGNISIANTNYETAFLLSTAFVGIILMGERKQMTKKIAGALLCTLGIILLNFF